MTSYAIDLLWFASQHKLVLDFDSYNYSRQLRDAGRHAGLFCAQKALELGGCPRLVDLGSERLPQWPIGFVGCITQCDEFAAAVVGPATQYQSVGVDVEAVASVRVVEHLKLEIADKSEWRCAEAVGHLDRTCFTIVYAAKEALYKCLYPIHRKFFGFESTKVVGMNDDFVSLQLESHDEHDLYDQKFEVKYGVRGDKVYCLTMVELDF